MLQTERPALLFLEGDRVVGAIPAGGEASVRELAWRCVVALAIALDFESRSVRGLGRRAPASVELLTMEGKQEAEKLMHM